MKNKALSLIIAASLFPVIFTGCGAADNDLTKNFTELVNELSPENESGSDPGQERTILHLHDENSEAYCVDFPSDWEIIKQDDSGGKTIVEVGPGEKNNDFVVAITYGRSDDPDIEEYVKKWKADNSKKHPNIVFEEGTTESNSYLYHVAIYTNDSGHLVRDYHIFDKDAELRIMQFTDPDDEELTVDVDEVTLMMVNSSVLYHPAEAAE